MSSLNDFNSMYGWDSPAVPPMFSQGEGLGPNPALTNPMVTSMPEVTGDWMASLKNIGTPSFMKSGFVPGTPVGGGNTNFLGLEVPFFSTPTQQGWGGTALGAAQGLFSGYLGMKQYGMAKEKLAESKRQFELNYAAQKTLTNSQLEDRQRARVASNPGAYQSVGDYMNQNGVR